VEGYLYSSTYLGHALHSVADWTVRDLWNITGFIYTNFEDIRNIPEPPFPPSNLLSRSSKILSNTSSLLRNWASLRRQYSRSLSFRSPCSKKGYTDFQTCIPKHHLQLVLSFRDTLLNLAQILAHSLQFLVYLRRRCILFFIRINLPVFTSSLACFYTFLVQNETNVWNI
jgi:hypothetical protein